MSGGVKLGGWISGEVCSAGACDGGGEGGSNP